MRVLYITGMYPTPAFPQNGIFCHEQVKALKAAGVEVDVVVPVVVYNKEIRIKSWVYEGVTIKYIRFMKLPGANYFHKTGQWLYQSLEKRVNLKDYDVLHADAALPSGYAAMKASIKYRIPYVVHVHGLDVFLDKSYANSKNVTAIRDLSKDVYQKADAVCGVSQKALGQVTKGINSTRRPCVVYNGVNVDTFTPIHHESSQNKTILSVGNLIPLKGHEYTIRAISILKKKGINAHLIILGRGEQEHYLKELVKELSLEEEVRFVGYVPYRNVVKYMQVADMFVLPSYFEALGCVYLEAMACGLPTVGCWGNGIDEIIKDGVNGYLVDGKDEKQLAECIENHFSNDNSNISIMARTTVVENYQWKHSAEKLIEVYKLVMA